MSTKELLQYCLAKQGAYIDCPFGNDYTVIKIKSTEKDKSRIFAEFYTLDGKDIFTFSTDADTALALRMEYPDSITRGWHCPPAQAKYKSTLVIADIADELLTYLADTSYLRALEKLK
ncbi:MAG: MmcQ/YjbR family DNA-binding protein [Clostridia bacterium]|nr:MmcQ/YjbR family DNA-binding protein [Clostridia bacterium]MDE6472353.1 MmcQ/YjbR family DNA-binding protein [Clostridia bacterium]